jgi:hypothetical protein
MGPCEPWPANFTCDITCESPSATGSALQTATEILWALSGRQFGPCEVTLRPCRKNCTDQVFWGNQFLPWSGSYPQPALIGGGWFNLVCGSCTGDCACTSLSEVVLPQVVNEILEVKIDGVVLGDDEYRVDNGNVLVRLDADWPWCQELNLPDTEEGTWSVTAEYGLPVPEAGKWAVGELACELLQAMRGDECRLPANVSAMTRQGVSFTFTDLLKDGKVGLYLSDFFLQSVNPAGLSSRPRVYSVDHPPARRVGTA